MCATPDGLVGAAGPEKAVRPCTHTVLLHFPRTRIEIVEFRLNCDKCENESSFSMNYEFLVLIRSKNRKGLEKVVVRLVTSVGKEKLVPMRSLPAPGSERREKNVKRKEMK